MKVDCGTIVDFLTNLADAREVYNRTVYVSTLKNPEGDGGVKIQVTVQASAVVVDDEDGNGHLLRCGEFCGLDYLDNGGEYAGSDRAAELRALVVALCEKRNWNIRPGVVGE